MNALNMVFWRRHAQYSQHRSMQVLDFAWIEPGASARDAAWLHQLGATQHALQLGRQAKVLAFSRLQQLRNASKRRGEPPDDRATAESDVALPQPKVVAGKGADVDSAEDAYLAEWAELAFSSDDGASDSDASRQRARASARRSGAAADAASARTHSAPSMYGDSDWEDDSTPHSDSGAADAQQPGGRFLDTSWLLPSGWGVRHGDFAADAPFAPLPLPQALWLAKQRVAWQRGRLSDAALAMLNGAGAALTR